MVGALQPLCSSFVLFTFFCPSFFFSSSTGHLLDALSDRIPDTELVLILIVLA